MAKNMYDKLSEERKKMQEAETMPEWFSTAGWQLFKDKYLYEAANPKEQYQRIANTAARYVEQKLPHPKGKVWSQVFFDLLWKGWLSASTPVLANTGTNRGLPVSCSGQYVEDSIDGIYASRRETAILTKHGFGTAGYMAIRPRGAPISVGGKSSGTLPVIKSFIEDMRYVSQGTARRGAFASYIEIDHPDMMEICAYVEQNPDDANIGWIISKNFIDKLDSGDPEAVSVYQRAMKMKMVTGKGYFFFKDKANDQSPQMYKDLGLKVEASQLCVAPETLILTKSGYEEISTLEDEVVEVWNGKEFSEVTVKKTGENQKLIKVVTNSGFELECTPYHKFYVSIRGSATPKEVRAKDLKRGDKLIKCDFPIIDGFETLNHAYANGFYSGDGCLTPAGKRIYLYGEKRKLKSHFGDIFKSWYIQENQDREYGESLYLKDKFFVPSNSYDIESRISWFEGLCDSDGTIARNGNTQSIQVGNINKPFLLEVQMMLQTLGVSSKVTPAKEAGNRQLPLNDGSGNKGDFYCQTSYRLLIGQTGIINLKGLGFNPKRLVITDHTPNRECSQFVKVVDIIDEGRVDDTFCFTEPKLGLGVFNGILTGQCSEILLHSSPEYTYTCVLSSMNLSKFDEWKDTDAVFEATVFLDCIAENFIDLAQHISGLEKAVSFTRKSRALGLGACGLHTLFQQKMLPFEGLEAHLLNNVVFTHLKKESERASEYMAVHLGEPEWCKGYGVRNTHTRAVAPTKSTALIMGGISEGINPDPAMVYTQLTAAGEVDRLNPTLLELMKSKGVYNQKNIQQVIDTKGSVQGVDWLDEHEKKVFKTAFEIDQKAILRLASLRQTKLDQGQSLNLFFSSDESEQKISEIHQIAFKDPNINALYYCYSRRGVSASKGECESCM